LNLSTTGHADFTVALATPVQPGMPLYLRWADDNAVPSPDRNNGLDNVSFQSFGQRNLSWTATNGTWDSASGNQVWTDGTGAVVNCSGML
jgi:hypothetical protein